MSMDVSLLGVGGVGAGWFRGGHERRDLPGDGRYGQDRPPCGAAASGAGRGGHAASRSGTPTFDWTDRGTWEQALQGVTAMYLLAPDLGSPQAAEAIAALTRQA